LPAEHTNLLLKIDSRLNQMGSRFDRLEELIKRSGRTA
jgi:hypothetical protein